MKSAQKPEVPCALIAFEAFPFPTGDILLFLMWLVCGSEMVAVMKMLMLGKRGSYTLILKGP